MNTGNRNPIVPFLKWAGGKRWLADLVAAILDGHPRHVEPFVGGAACFFASCAIRGLLSDNNDELMNCFRVVRDDPQALIARLSQLTISKRTFEHIRNADERTSLNRAVRFIYLNRTAFNGLYRVNQLGEFNVPFGCKRTTIVCDEQAILRCSSRLQSTELVTCDFRTTLNRTRCTDGLYVDPPYTVKHNNNAFRRYNERIFSWEDQACLAGVLCRLASRNVPIVATNAFHHDVIAMYSARHFWGFAVSRASNMAASAFKRGTCEELLLISRAAAPNVHWIKRLIEHHIPSRAVPLRLRRE